LDLGGEYCNFWSFWRAFQKSFPENCRNSINYGIPKMIYKYSINPNTIIKYIGPIKIFIASKQNVRISAIRKFNIVVIYDFSKSQKPTLVLMIVSSFAKLIIIITVEI
jgi:hypothetical protein